MASKRPLPAPDDGGELSRPRKRWRSLVLEVRGRRRSMHGLFGFQDIRGEEFMSMLLPRLGSMLRRVVSEEVEKAFYNQYHAPPPRLLLDRNQKPRYQLLFMNKLNRAYTMMRLETALKVAIVDTNQNVVSFGHLSSVKVEIVVLHGNFNAKDEENWSADEFNRHIVRGREKSGQLLTGNLVLKLNNGEASLDNATFTDNSSFTSTKKFRLGVRLVHAVGERVLEGITEPFPVKERRVEASEKHHPPSLNDEVWRLEKIARNGVHHQALSSHGIETVQEFLQSYVKDEEKLLGIFGKMSKSAWKAIICHAKQCVLGDYLYSCHIADKNAVLFFDSIYQLAGVKSDTGYKAVNQLNPVEKDSVETLKLDAYENMNGARYDHEMVDNYPVPLYTNDNIFAASSSTHMQPSVHQIPNYGQEASQSNQQQASSVKDVSYFSSSLGGISIGQGFEAKENNFPFQESSHASVEMSRLVQYQNTNGVQFNHQMITNNIMPHQSDPCTSFSGLRFTQLHNSNPQQTDFGQDPIPAVVHGKISTGQVPIQCNQQQVTLLADEFARCTSQSGHGENFSSFQEPYDGISVVKDNLLSTDAVLKLMQTHLQPTTTVAGKQTMQEMLHSQTHLPSNDRHFQHSRTNSFDPNSCDEILQNFLAHMRHDQYQDFSCCASFEPEVTGELTEACWGGPSGAAPPLSPRKWVKIKAALKWVSVTRVSRRSRLPPLPKQRLVPTV